MSDSLSPDNHKPRWQDLVAIVLLAIVLRVGLAAIVMCCTHTSLHAYAMSSDGGDYIAMARAWQGDLTEVQAKPFALRLFPGYPAIMVALNYAGVPMDWASLLPSWLAAGLLAGSCALFFKDRRIGWAMAALTPSAMLNGSLVSTETVSTLFCLIGLWRGVRDDAVGAGLLLGMGGLVRSQALFPFLGYLAFQACRKRWRGAAVATVLAGALSALALVAIKWRFGDALLIWHRDWNDPAAFGGELFTWPFKGMLTTPAYPGSPPVAPYKIAFIWLHAVLVVAGCLITFSQWRSTVGREARAFPALMGLWLIGNTVFVLCLGGAGGFNEFPRYILPALPPLLWAYRGILPRREWLWVLIGAASVVVAFPPAKARMAQAPPPTTAPAAAVVAR